MYSLLYRNLISYSETPKKKEMNKIFITPKKRVNPNFEYFQTL